MDKVEDKIILNGDNNKAAERLEQWIKEQNKKESESE